MSKVSLKDLKQNLASWVELAHQGTPVDVMKYNQPFVRIVPWNPSELHVGSQFGKTSLKSSLGNVTHGKWAKYLQEDREE
jgi:antitoxin (DNA-binding transcriptional repressor) of toxin-antitoxin stability system